METEVEDAIFTELAATATARGTTCAWGNVAFERDGLDDYFAVDLLSTDPELLGVCNGWARYRWIVQVRVYVRDGVGLSPALAHVDALREAYPVLHVFTAAGREYTVTHPVARYPAVRESGWSFVPAQLRVSTIE